LRLICLFFVFTHPRMWSLRLDVCYIWKFLVEAQFSLDCHPKYDIMTVRSEPGRCVRHWPGPGMPRLGVGMPVPTCSPGFQHASSRVPKPMLVHLQPSAARLRVLRAAVLFFRRRLPDRG
jgi:hypothetical protein